MWLFYYFNSERNYDVLKSKCPCILLNKFINLNKNKTESKMEIPHTVLERRRQTWCFSSYKNYKLKVKLWRVGARKRENRAFFIPVILFEGIFFNICVLSQCILHWIHLQNIYTFIYQKALLCTLRGVATNNGLREAGSNRTFFVS